ncbi:MAG: hypothetical protein AAFU53_01265 [Cyanobacteria bacterium J06632_3]
MFRLFRRLFNVFRRSPRQEPVSSTERSAASGAGSDAGFKDGSNTSTPDSEPSHSLPSENTVTLENTMPVNRNTPPESAPSSGATERLRDGTVLGESIAEERAAEQANEKPQRTSMKDLKIVLNVLRAYIVTFGDPDTQLDLRAVIGAIVANVNTVDVDNRRLERFMDDVLAAYESLGADASLVDVTSQLLAEQVSVWLKTQQTTVSNVVSAYLQQFAPEDSTWDSGEILSLVQTTVAVLNDGSLSRSGGRALIRQVIEAFDLDQAMSRWVAPEWVALAQQVSSYEEKTDLQSELRSVAWSYVQQFESILSPQLIEQIIETGPINVSPEELLSGDLSAFSEMLFYKYQFIEADPVVTKSHEEIAVDVRKAIQDFLDRRGPGIDITKPETVGDLELRSPFFRDEP